jgi:hypothetical protein
VVPVADSGSLCADVGPLSDRTASLQVGTRQELLCHNVSVNNLVASSLYNLIFTNKIHNINIPLYYYSSRRLSKIFYVSSMLPSKVFRGRLKATRITVQIFLFSLL